jgi:hypothetical protein
MVQCFGAGFLVSESVDELGVVGTGGGGALFAADKEEQGDK